MNNSRDDLLPYNYLFTGLKQLEEDINALKNRQRSSAKSGVLGYTIQTSSTHDITQTVTDSFVLLKLTYTGDGSQQTPIANPYMNLSINSVKMDAVNQRVDDGVNLAIMQRPFLEFDKSSLESPFSLSWLVEFSVAGTMTYRAKGYAVASSPGTVSVVRVS